MKKYLLLVLTVLILSYLPGCAKLAHLEQLLTLKAVSDNRDAQKKFVEEQNKRFEELLEIVKKDSLRNYPDKKSILKNFGEPVFTRDIVRHGQPLELWLYRYATKYFGSEKVYLYFDETGKLVDFGHFIPPENQTAQNQNKGQ